MELVAKCPKCDAGLPVSATDAPAAIKCGRCGREMPLTFSDDVRADRAVDRCPVCNGSDFYLRKDFDPKVGVTVVIIGALISASFYWFGRDLIAYSILGERGAHRSRRLRQVERRHRVLPLPHRVPRRLHALGRRVRSPHGRRARTRIRATHRTPLRSLNSPIATSQPIVTASARGDAPS